ncbi:ROK family protein [Bifidobacterium jacchi]|uniref:ROK family protein n=1 Tax=Bifidobacterium jacchi TaxID=2490545 RepID=A0A5N5RI43_9BIFI|nr:ROK family protein [Bifidobacterium jacchi]KAB5606431.1 ROK family protein [Bifidobacterium jacchi]
MTCPIDSNPIDEALKAAKRPSEETFAVGVDVGGTKIETVLVDATGMVLADVRVPARRGGDNVIDDIARTVREVAGDHLNELAVVGVGTPGQVDSEHGVVRNVVNLDIDTLELGEKGSKILGVPVRVENDVNAAAVGAAALLGTPQKGAVAFLNFGTGLAAGIIIDGHLQHGYSGSAGEIGHIPIDPNQLPCPCGQHGCLETICSGASVGRLWTHGNPPMPDLIRQARAGNEEAIAVLAKVTHAIVDAMQIVAQSIDPSVIIFGGGMAKTGEPLVEVTREEIARREASCPFLTTLNLGDRIRLAPVDQPVGAVGAALAALQA